MKPNLRVRSGDRVLVLANCQTGGLTSCLSLLMPNVSVIGMHWLDTDGAMEAASVAASEADVVITSAPLGLRQAIAERHGFDDDKVMIIPSIYFSGFDPDVTYASASGRQIRPVITSPYHSAIGLWCWTKGMTVKQTAKLFTPETARALGYHQSWPLAQAQARDHFSVTDVSFADFLLPLQASGERFMHTANHPSIKAIAALSKIIAKNLGASSDTLALPVHDLVPDALAHEMTWPIYPGVGEAIGLAPYLTWRIYGQLYDLESYLDAQFSALSAADGPIEAAPLRDASFESRMHKVVTQ